MKIQAVDYAVVGDDPVGDQPKKCWKVLIDEYKGVNPKDYFITTGEALVKLDYVMGNLKDLMNSLKKLRTRMVKSKSTSKYLETSWEGGILVVKRKDARVKDEDKDKDKE